jgi:hypothetical protein
MFIAAATVSVLLAALLVYSAVRKLSHSDEVVRSYARAGVPERSLNTLAAILIAGAVGLVVGLWWKPLGIAAAACLVVYFATACGFHVRAHDTRHLSTPVTMAVLALASLVLQLAT